MDPRTPAQTDGTVHEMATSASPPTNPLLRTVTGLRLLPQRSTLWHRGHEQGVDPFSTEENKAIVRRWFAVWEKKNVDLIDELHSPDYVGHIVGTPGPVRGREALKQLFATYLAALEVHRSNELLMAEGDLVAAYDTYRVRHIGELAGIPPTGKELTITGIDIYRLVDGKIVEQWYEMDFTGLLQQLRSP
jgi:predicted ester cyclase